MTWGLLSRLDIVCRPLSDWPGARTPMEQRSNSRFEAAMSNTVEILGRELRALDAERIVLQVDLRPSQIRLDGLPRADARAASPGVVLGFDSKHGPLRYACDRFVASRWKREGGEDWQHNLRAIALGLEALRTVDRYGITKRGEQYRGWAELPAGIPQPATHMTTEDAIKLIASAAGVEPDLVEAAAFGVGDLPSVVRAALAATHPDRCGDHDRFIAVQAARELLTRAKADTGVS